MNPKGMIYRPNYFLVNDYLQYRRDVHGLRPESVTVIKRRLIHLLEWALDASFKQAPKKRPTFPTYVKGLTHKSKGSKLDPNSKRRIVSDARQFFEWLRDEHKDYQRSITKSFINQVHPLREEKEPKQYEKVQFDEIIEMMNLPVRTLGERRIRAATAFLYLSGVRVGAFVTLPIKAIDLQAKTVLQFPSLGTRTKYRKHATTHLLSIPELFDVVKDWDQFVRSQLPDDAMWFAPIGDNGKLKSGVTPIATSRDDRVRKDLRAWLESNGMIYRSPHKFRHGHAVYGVKHAGTVTELKALSQNLMHSNLQTTDGIYGILSETDVGDVINNFGQAKPKEDSSEIAKLTAKIDMLLKLMATQVQTHGAQGSSD